MSSEMSFPVAFPIFIVHLQKVIVLYNGEIFEFYSQLLVYYIKNKTGESGRFDLPIIFLRKKKPAKPVDIIM